MRLPAKNAKSKKRFVMVMLTDDQATKLERLRIAGALKSWPETFRQLLQKAKVSA